MMKALREGNKIKPNLGNDVFIESEVGAAVFAGIDLPLQMGHKQPPHTSNSENSTLDPKPPKLSFYLLHFHPRENVFG